MLNLTNVRAGYDGSQVLHGVEMSVQEGEVVTLLGRNGMGKSTTIMCLCGLLPLTEGRIEFNGLELQRLQNYQIARLGIGLVPEQRHIFNHLTVRENLLVAAANYSKAATPWNLASIYALFPRLQEREKHLGNQLSGGEQQMLAIARALMINPRLLVLDEASEGLAPLIVEEIWQVIRRLKQQGQSILVVDKNLNTLLDIADRYYLMEKGMVVATGMAQQLKQDHELQTRYLGV
jgi:branched-chain amino acid transport system ATP-binding protein